jgi:hypothetical protein
MDTSEGMNAFGFEYEGVVDFLDATHYLSTDDIMILSRDTIEILSETSPVGYGSGHKYITHYDNLNHLADILYTRFSEEQRVTEEFQPAAERLLATPGYQPYMVPMLTIINHETEASIMVPMDIPELIRQGVLPIYAVDSRTERSGQEVTVDIAQYIREAAVEVGIEPSEAYIAQLLEDERGSYVNAVPLGAANLTSTTFFSSEEVAVEGEGDFVVDPRGEAALILMQLNLLNRLEESAFRQTTEGDSSLEIAVRLAPQPDITRTIHELIRLVEKNHLKLIYYRTYKSTNILGSVLAPYDRVKNESRGALAFEYSVDTAILNAYTQVQRIFPD